MKSSQLILSNAMLWLVAILAHPVSRLFPAESGEPPRIFSLLIPMLILVCGFLSTLFMKSALQQQSGT